MGPNSRASARLAIDIGGTFTDLALEYGHKWHTAKVLTTPSAPEVSVIGGINAVLRASALPRIRDRIAPSWYHSGYECDH